MFALGLTGSSDGALSALDSKDAKDMSSAKQRDIGRWLSNLDLALRSAFGVEI